MKFPPVMEERFGAASATSSFVFEAGALTRGPLVRELTKAAWTCGVEISFEEQKTWLRSLYRVTIRGYDSQVIAFVESATAWLRRRSKAA